MPYPFEPHRIDNAFNVPVSYGYHEGIDLNVAGTSGNQDCGTELKSISSGICVHRSQSDLNYGNLTVIETLFNGVKYYIRYCHQNQQRVEVGDEVKIGTIIGTEGDTGNSTACHLHLDILKKRPPHWRYYTKEVLEWFKDPIEFISEYKEVEMPETIVVEIKDWERVLRASRLGDRLINGLGFEGNIADKSETQIDIIIAEHKATKENLEACRNLPVATPPTTDPNPDPTKYELNGLQVTVEDPNNRKTYNYKLK